MQLGLLTAPFPDQTLAQVADWSAANGFSVLEVACWPVAGAEKRRYAGTAHVDVASLTAAQGADIAAGLAAKGVSISALGLLP